MVNFAHCDIKTGEIYGCVPFSNKYYHEEGHLKFNKLEATSNLLLFKSYVFLGWFVAITCGLIYELLFFIKIIIGLCAFIYLFIELYEEWWCNQYANKKINEIQNNLK